MLAGYEYDTVDVMIQVLSGLDEVGAWVGDEVKHKWVKNEIKGFGRRKKERFDHEV